MFPRIFACACLALMLSACAAREYTPVSMVQSGDDDLSCTAINQQIAANTATQAAFEANDRDVANGNTAKVVAGTVAGAVIPFAGLAMIGSTDLSNEEQAKARALADRNEHLEYIKKQRGCGA
jgi:hypothetical protein